MKKGFSLVELSIVLVILGLLVGGILAGQSLIRAAELRAVSTEYQRYLTAFHAFRDKYFALPGDMTNATAFWGKDNAQCTAHTGTTATPGTCNGDGNGQIAVGAAGAATSEMFRIWQHLALAGLIEGTYTGNAGPDTQFDVVAGTNAPRSKLNRGSWLVRNYFTNFSDGTLLQNFYGNWGQFGNDAAVDNGDPVLRPEEAWNIDTKLDDGKPGTGSVVIRQWSTCTNAASATDTTTSYNLSSTAIGCTLVFPRIF